MLNSRDNLTVIIPAYEPPSEFVSYAEEVLTFAKRLVVVNDGSGAEFDGVFERIAALEGAVYLTYAENHGKGYALKTALEWCIENCGEGEVLVTADCDGQHKSHDVKKVYAIAAQHSDALVLGSRNFNEENVPPRSRFGNVTTRTLFKLFYGINVSDTQTGLRGFSRELAKKLMAVRGNRFEYEMNVLIRSGRERTPIIEVPIETVYPENAEEHVSHFRTVSDSLRVLGAVLRNLNFYMLSSVLSAVTDVVAFYLLSTLLFASGSALDILLATVIARVTSSIINFIFNFKLVFNGNSWRSVVRYYILWACQLGASYGIAFVFGTVVGLSGIWLALAKGCGDLVLAVFSYQIQRAWVFKRKESGRFYGAIIRFFKPIARFFSKSSRSNVARYEGEGVVYVTRHLNMHGPFSTIKWLDFDVHPMVLSCFCTRHDCYVQYRDYTFTVRHNKKKPKFSMKAWLASRIVPAFVGSLRAVPVYRGSMNIAKTMRCAIDFLEAGEDVIVYPDVEYTGSADNVSDIYEGFLFLGELYKKRNGKSLKFVPIYIDDNRRALYEGLPVTVDSFRDDAHAASEYIKSAINGIDMYNQKGSHS